MWLPQFRICISLSIENCTEDLNLGDMVANFVFSWPRLESLRDSFPWIQFIPGGAKPEILDLGSIKKSGSASHVEQTSTHHPTMATVSSPPSSSYWVWVSALTSFSGGLPCESMSQINLFSLVLVFHHRNSNPKTEDISTWMAFESQTQINQLGREHNTNGE